jgi:Enoyl-CoA hydratase/carnithine racemase
MDFETILSKKEEHIGQIILNRPDKRNALNRKMMQELTQAIEDAAQDDEVRVVILSGEGKAFCAGADTDIMPGGTGEQGLGGLSVEELRRSFAFNSARKIVMGLQRIEKPTIAMVNGACVGAGFDLALACDMRFGSEDARFMCGFVKIGLFPGFGATWLYPRIMGMGKALELLFTGDTINAGEAARIGILNKVVSSEELSAATMVLARKIAAGPPIALRLMKAQVYKGLDMNLDSALSEAAMCEAITLASQDHRKGVSALREKREPLFTGD